MRRGSRLHPVHMTGKTVWRMASGHTVWMISGRDLSKSVQTLEVIAWPDLGCEAVRRLTVRDMPLTVVLDAHGGDLYETGPAAYLAAL